MQEKKEYQLLQKYLLSLILFTSTMSHWYSEAKIAIKNHHDKIRLDNAAMKIQSNWRRELFARKAKQALLIKRRLHRVGCLLIFSCKCIRRRLSAQLIRSFFSDFAIK